MTTPFERLVAHFGDQIKTAAALGVSQPAVSQWVSGACHMSAANAFAAESKTNGQIMAWELCGQIPPPANRDHEVAYSSPVVMKLAPQAQIEAVNDQR